MRQQPSLRLPLPEMVERDSSAETVTQSLAAPTPSPLEASLARSPGESRLISFGFKTGQVIPAPRGRAQLTPSSPLTIARCLSHYRPERSRSPYNGDAFIPNLYTVGPRVTSETRSYGDATPFSPSVGTTSISTYVTHTEHRHSSNEVKQ